jgi:HAE1 family hydrophobic/amphiphilic exporter-1
VSVARRATERPVAVAMLVVAVVLIGALSYGRLPVDLLPDIAYPRLSVMVSYPGVAPTEVERFVTEPVERAVAAVPGVDEVRSVARDGQSLTTLRFAWGTDMDFAALDVREKLDEMRAALPAGAGRPVVLRSDPSAEAFMAVSVTAAPASPTAPAVPSVPPAPDRDGSDVFALADFAELVVKRRLEQIDGVAQAAVTGAPEREIHVDVDPARLESHALTAGDVAAAISAANQRAPGGTIRRGRHRYALRTLGELATVRQIADVVVTRRHDPPPGVIVPSPAAMVAGRTGTLPGRGVRLGDLATVADGARERESIARFDGREAIGLLLYKESGANTVQAARRAERALAELRVAYPDVTLAVASSQAGFISAAIGNVVQEMVVGGVLAVLVLFAFLRDPRVPLAIAVVIPVSVVATFALLDAAGASLNVMSLGGLALGVALLMDNSIVVVENIVRHRELGAPPAAAAAVGADEVQAPVVTATLTTIAVFGPIVYVRGVAGELFGSLALAVAFSLAASVVIALTVVPALAARWRGATGDVASGRALAPVVRGYERALGYALDHRGRVVALAGVLAAATILIASRLDRSLLPRVDQGAFRVRLELPRGTPLDRTSAEAARMEAVLGSDSAVGALFTAIGRPPAVAGPPGDAAGPNTATIDVRLRTGQRTAEVVARLRAAHVAAGATITIDEGRATALGALLGGDDAGLLVHLYGDDADAAARYARQLGRALSGVPSIVAVYPPAAGGQPELRVEVNRQGAAAYGIEAGAVADAVRGYTRGTPAGDFVAFDRAVPITVRPLPLNGTDGTLAAVAALRVDGVPLRELARVREVTGPAEVRRLGQRRVVTVGADVSPGRMDDAVRAVRAAVAAAPPPAGLRVEVGGESGEMHRGFLAIALAFGLAVLLVYMILAAEFESLLHPFTVLLSVPLALVGAVAALWVTGAGLNVVSLIGVVVLVGIVDNDAVMKVDFILQMRRRGLSVRDAIFAAGHARLRPILINTMTALLGLLPMALGVGPGAALQAPLAIAVFGGLLSSTVLTLVVIPVAFSLVEDARAWFRGERA